jgi:signal transduction histidine kinase/PAS domain-containing protein
MKTKEAERKERDPELRATLERDEEQFRMFQELSLDGFAQLRCLRNPAGQIKDFEWTYANPVVERLFLRGGAGLVGRRLLQDAPDDPQARELFDHYVRVVEHGQPHDLELKYQRPDAPGWYRNVAVKLADGLGVSFQDITQRKENEEALRKLLASLQAVFANTLHSFVFLDREGQIQAFDEIAKQRAMAVCGEEIRVGRSIYDFVRPAQRAGFDQHFAQALAGETIRVERDFAAPGQPAAWFECLYAPIRGEGAAATGGLFSALPINERKQLEQRQEVQRVAALSISRAATVPDLLQRCLASARELAGMAGGGLFRRDGAGAGFLLVESEGLPEGWTTLVRAVPTDSPLGALLSGARPVYARLQELPPLLADPAESAEQVVAILPLSGQTVVDACLFLVAARPQTPSPEHRADLEVLAAQAGAVWLRLQAQEQARLALEQERQLSRLKSRFLSLASHEFRNPLTVAAAAAELLRKHLPKLSESQREELFELIRNSAQRITAMLDEVLVIGRTDNGNERFTPVPVDLAALVRGLVEEARLADRGQHEFGFDCPEPTLPGVGNARLLRHVLGNLLSNAALYSPAATRIETTLRRADGAVLIAVRDRGRGIPLKDRERIWEAFERGSNVRDLAGSGLGLHIAKRMADLHGATLGCESELGRGTTFMLRLPDQPARDRGEP